MPIIQISLRNLWSLKSDCQLKKLAAADVVSRLVGMQPKTRWFRHNRRKSKDVGLLVQSRLKKALKPAMRRITAW